MSQFLVLIYRDEAAADVDLRERPGGMTREHIDFCAKHEAAVLGGNALHNAATARSVRRDRDGAVLVTDGAFAETKEVLGGYYLIEAPDMEAAVRIAADVPTLDGGVEVRPVRTVPMRPAG